MLRRVVALVLAAAFLGACGSDTQASDLFRLAGDDPEGAAPTAQAWADELCTQVAPPLTQLDMTLPSLGGQRRSDPVLAERVAVEAYWEVLYAIRAGIAGQGAPPVANGAALTSEYPEAITNAVRDPNEGAALFLDLLYDVGASGPSLEGVPLGFDLLRLLGTGTSFLDVSPQAAGAWDAVVDLMAGAPACAIVGKTLPNS